MIHDRPAAIATPTSTGSGDFNIRTLWALTMLGILFGFSMVDRLLLSLNLEPIKHELHATDTQMSLATGMAFFMFNAIASVPFARFADRNARMPIIALGFAFYSLVTACMGMVGSFTQLFVARALQGAGEASGQAPASALVNDLVSPRNRRKALAGLRVFGAVVVMGMTTLLGYINEFYGWRAACFVLAIPAAFIVPLLMFVREPVRDTKAGAPVEPRVSLRDAWRQWRRSPAFLLVLVGFAFSLVTLQANGAWAAAFLARVREMPPSEIGALAGLARGPGLLAGSLLGGWLTDRLSRRDHRWRFWVPGIMLLLGTPCEFVYLTADPYWVFAPAYVLTGALIMGSNVCVIAICMDVSGEGLRATGLAVALLLSNLLADLIGPTSIGLMNDTIFASYGVLALRYSMAIVACLAALGGISILWAARFETEATRSG